MTTTLPAMRKAAYRKWLVSLASDDADSVGGAQDNEACPIAVWLFAGGVVSPSVSRTHARGYIGPNRSAVRRLPSWAQEFVEGVDHLPFRTAVTRDMALDILDHGGAASVFAR